MQDIGSQKVFAQLLAAACVRRGELEGLHAGIVPVSKSGDFSDVYVVDATGRQIPWSEVSRIDQTEMKALMVGTVNRVYTFLARTLFSADDDEAFERAIDRAVAPWVDNWDEPNFLPEFLMPAATLPFGPSGPLGASGHDVQADMAGIMAEFELTVTSADPDLVLALADPDAELADQGLTVDEPMRVPGVVDAAAFITAQLLSVPAGVAASLVAAWIWQAFQSSTSKAKAKIVIKTLTKEVKIEVSNADEAEIKAMLTEALDAVDLGR